MPKNVSEIAVELLNEFYKADPEACAMFFAQSVVCNKAVENHPHIIVGGIEGTSAVGVLGVINGILTASGNPKIAKITTDTFDGSREKIIGFKLYEESKRG